MKNWRINVVLVLIIILGVAIISRLFNIQILNHKFYQSQALGQQAGFSEAQGQRGEIFLKNSQVLFKIPVCISTLLNFTAPKAGISLIFCSIKKLELGSFIWFLILTLIYVFELSIIIIIKI